MNGEKLIYLVLLILLGSVLVLNTNIIEKSKYDEVLPDAKYCIERDLELSFNTITEEGDSSPVEYCKLDDFCEVFEASTVKEFNNFEETLLEQKKNQVPNMFCFEDEAKNTQRNFEGLLQGEKVKSKFLCCNSKEPEIRCKPNDCGGSFLGQTDEEGCKIYAKEVCKAGTNCKSLGGGERVCDPQPFGDDCMWETKESFGDTHFTTFNNCGLEIEQVCGTVANYRCTKFSKDLCDLSYGIPTGKFVSGCGGHVVI